MSIYDKQLDGQIEGKTNVQHHIIGSEDRSTR